MKAAATSARPRPAYRRRVRYVDSSMQRSLLLAMVALEVVLVVALTWLAYWHLNDLIEENLYRVHLAQTDPIFARLAGEGYAVLAWFAGVNVVALMVAEGIWRHHKNLVLRDFTRLIRRTRELDFSSDVETPRQHEVLALAVDWRARERTRFTAIRDQVAKLEAAVLAEESPRDTRNAVESLNKLVS